MLVTSKDPGIFCNTCHRLFLNKFLIQIRVMVMLRVPRSRKAVLHVLLECAVPVEILVSLF